MMNRGSIGKGTAYLYIEALSMLFSGYIYWLILSILTSPSVIGVSSTVISIVTIFTSIASVGVTGGIQSLMGKNLSQNKHDDLKKHINSSFVIIGIGITGTIGIMYIMQDWMYQYFQVDFMLLMTAMIMMIVTAISALCRALIIPSLNTRVITISSIFSTLVKIMITIFLVLLDAGTLGILIGFTMYPLVTLIVLLTSIKKSYYRDHKSSIEIKLSISFFSIRSIFASGIGFWVPGIINSVGSQLGTVLVYLSNGSGVAGIYFISLSIVTGISVVMSVLSLIAYPIISSLIDGRKRAIWRLIRLSLVLTLPLSNALTFYSEQILHIFGDAYSSGSESLLILLLSIFPTAIINGVGVLAYAYNQNRQFLFIGLLTSIPRVFLYLILVPGLGDNGAALAYLIGALIGAVGSILIANRMGLKLFWKELSIIFATPLVISAFCNIIQIQFILGILITLIFSYMIYIKFNTLDLEDVKDILKVLPPSISKPSINLFVALYTKLRKY